MAAALSLLLRRAGMNYLLARGRNPGTPAIIDEDHVLRTVIFDRAGDRRSRLGYQSSSGWFPQYHLGQGLRRTGQGGPREWTVRIQVRGDTIADALAKLRRERPAGQVLATAARPAALTDSNESPS